MIDDVGEPFLQHHLLLKCVGVVREALMHWITNMPRYHCYLVSEIQMMSKLKEAFTAERVNKNKKLANKTPNKVGYLRPQWHSRWSV